MQGPVLICVAALALHVVHAIHVQIPSVDSYLPDHSASSFQLDHKTSIIVHGNLSSPHSSTLYDYATTFREDLGEVLSVDTLPPVQHSDQPAVYSLSASVIEILLTPDNFTYYSGAPSSEGYQVFLTSKQITITGSHPLGVWWGTRTLLQQVAAAHAVTSSRGEVYLEAGFIRDSPGWPVRGFMLDAGRHWFEPQFIVDLCTYASFFKMNEFHIHTSDNLWNPDFLYGTNESWRHLYTGFRLRPAVGSPVDGIVPSNLRNESWSRDDWENMQTKCSRRGVTLVPEIDTPGHSLGITKWKPELSILDEPDNLNLTHPETMPTIKALWDEFLPWIASSEVSIGADEYDTAYADTYISFLNEMSAYIYSKSGKHIRVWGTNEPTTTNLTVSTNITIQHWNFPDGSIPVQLMGKGFNVINSEQFFLYLDGKTSDDGQFPQSIDENLLWYGSPDGNGWAPNIFSHSDASNNTSPQHPRLRGAIFALWNDWGNNATTPLEIYYQLAKSIPLVAEKTWSGTGVRTPELTQDQFDAAYPILNAAAPGQNLNRSVKLKHSDIVFKYDLSERQPGSVVHTGFESVGPPYRLDFQVMDDPNKPGSSVLFSGADTTLLASNLTFVSYGQHYPLPVKLPTERFANVSVEATRTYTRAWVEGQEYWWMTDMDIWGEYMKKGNMSFAAPAGKIGEGESGVRFGKVELRLV